MDLDAADLGKSRRKVIPYPGGDPLEGWQFEPFDLVQKTMIELVAHPKQFAFDVLEVADKARIWRWSSRQPYDDAEGMTVHPAVWMIFGRVRKEMCGVKKEFLVNAHQRIPITLCVWRERRHLGWARQ